jgi:hypothetical protein
MYCGGEHLPGTGTMAMQLVAWCVGVGVQHMDQLLKGTVSNQYCMWTLETGDYWGY